MGELLARRILAILAVGRYRVSSQHRLISGRRGRGRGRSYVYIEAHKNPAEILPFDRSSKRKIHRRLLSASVRSVFERNTLRDRRRAISGIRDYDYERSVDRWLINEARRIFTLPIPRLGISGKRGRGDGRLFARRIVIGCSYFERASRLSQVAEAIDQRSI